MEREKLPLLAVGVTIGLVALSGLAVTYPALTTMGKLEEDSAALQREVEAIEARSHSTQDLAAALNRAQAEFDRSYKVVPTTPAIADLIRKLGRFDDGQERSRRQTLTTGQVQDEDDRVKSLPVILETRGAFPDAFDLVRRIEGLDRLSRLRRVTVLRDKNDPDVIRATIQLDAFFEETAGGARAAADH